MSQANVVSAKNGASWTPVWIFIGVVILLLALLIWQAPRISQYNLGAIVVTIYVIVGLLSAVVLYRILDSTGAAEGTVFGVKFKFTGPAALVVVFLIVGVYSRGDPTFAVQFVVYYEGTDKKAPIDGEVNLTLQGPLTAQIRNGYGSLTGVPSVDRGSSVTLSEKFSGYELVTRQVKLDPDKPIPLQVREQKIAILERAGTANKTAIDKISGIPTGEDWPRRSIEAIGHLDKSALTADDRKQLLEEYRKGTERLLVLIAIPSDELSDDQAQAMENITQIIYDLQGVIGTQADWDNTYGALRVKRPQMLTKLHIHSPR